MLTTNHNSLPASYTSSAETGNLATAKEPRDAVCYLEISLCAQQHKKLPKCQPINESMSLIEVDIRNLQQQNNIDVHCEPKKRRNVLVIVSTKPNRF